MSGCKYYSTNKAAVKEWNAIENGNTNTAKLYKLVHISYITMAIESNWKKLSISLNSFGYFFFSFGYLHKQVVSILLREYL